MNSGYIRIPDEVIRDIKNSTIPICFHCGARYIKDIKYCDEEHNTWMPECRCISKTTIRIVIGMSK